METSQRKDLPQRLLSNKQLFVDIILIILGAYFVTCSVIPERMDADIIVPSIAALKNPTLFYWGQDRLLALTTFLLIPIRDIQLNLFLNTFLQASYFCILTLLITKYTSGERRSRSLGYCLSIFLLCWLIPKAELFTFAKHQQPYCAATVAALLSFRTIESHRPIKKENPSNFFVTSLLSAIALLLNPLSLILLLSQPLSAWAVNRISNRSQPKINCLSTIQWLLPLSIAIASYLIIKNLYSHNFDISSTNLELSLERIPHALAVVSKSFWSTFNNNVMSLIILTGSTLLCTSRLILMLLTNIYPKSANTEKQLLDHNFCF